MSNSASVANDQPLFRREAVAATQVDWLGEVVFARPVSFQIMAAFAMLVIAGVIAIGAFASYTRKSTVTGEIVPESGVIKLYSPISGVVTKANVHEGQHVRKGQVLYLISADRVSARGSVQNNISSDIKTSALLLQGQIEKLKSLQAEDQESLSAKVRNFQQELTAVDRMISIQTRRVLLSADIEKRYETLLQQQLVSDAEARAKEAELLDQQSRLVSLQQLRTTTIRDMKTAEVELRELPLKSGSALAGVSLQYQTADTALQESESKREVAIVAPGPGMATTITAQPGQAVDPAKPVVSLLPDNTKLHAVLYARSKDIGFVQIGGRVRLRYEAYPYQQYGMGTGTVTSVARSALDPEELRELGSLLFERSGPGDRGSPLYRITVRLDSQQIIVAGKPKPLRPAMLLEADILQDTRRLYRWIFEPLYALKEAS